MLAVVITESITACVAIVIVIVIVIVIALKCEL